MLVVAANQVAPTVSEARTLEQFIAPAYERIWALARNLWWSWDPGAESLFRDLDPLRWEQLDHNPIALLSEISMDDFDARSRRHVSYSTLNYAYRRLQEYLASDRHLGGGQRRRALLAAGRLFLGRVRPARVAADLFRRPGRSGRRPFQECERPGRARSSAWACSTTKAISVSGSTRKAGRRRIISKSTSPSCRWSWPSAKTTARSPFALETRSGKLYARRVASHRRPQPARTCSIRTSREMRRRIAA